MTDTRSCGACLSDTARRLPHKTALIYNALSYTWGEVDAIVSALAFRMRQRGVGPGTHVGIWSVNSPNWVFTFLACCRLGALPIPINTACKTEELCRLLNYAEVRFLCYGKGHKDLLYEPAVARTKERCPLLRELISISEEGEQYSLASFTPAERSREAVETVLQAQSLVRSDDTAVILFTSGTTSDAKGVMLTHGNLVNTALATRKAMRWQEDDILCVPLALFHCFGLTSSLLSCIAGGMTLCLLPQFRPVPVMEAIERHRCTVFNGVPTLFLALIRNRHFGEYKLGSLRSGIIAGSAIYPRDMEQLRTLLPSLTLIPSYGLTETSPAVTFADWEESPAVRAASSGKVLPGVELCIMDEQGFPVPADTPGEIFVRGYNVMKGYYHRREETEATFWGPWLKTGDLGHMDAAGHLFVQGRKKETINRGGENIAPAEVEDAIRALPWIEDAAVLGIPAPVIQEEVVACLIPTVPDQLREAEIRARLKEQIADYKIPQRYFAFADFPTTSSGKVKRSELKEEVLRRLGKADK